MKNSKLVDFLIALGTDPAVLQRYQQDPNAAMEAAGLSAEEKALLSKRDQNQLRAAIVALGGADSTFSATAGTSAYTPPSALDKPGSTEE